MIWNFENSLQFFQTAGAKKLLGDFKCGLERECLRINKKGEIAQTPHPAGLGSALKNPYITTDFSEAQLELITPPLNGPTESINFLKHLHCFISKTLQDEWIWPFSMPSRLPDEKKIPIAHYGTSAEAQKKHLYRQGLAKRYGRKMQTVSGIHYNFSFSEKFWQHLYKKSQSKAAEQDFISEKHFDLIRNFLRLSWLNTYLFGATPAADKTYFDKLKKPLKKHGKATYYAPYGTSLRMSNVGYYSKVQAQLNVSHNSLEEYLEGLKYAINTPDPTYKNFPGLNDHKLQLPNEHYARIRPKRVDRDGNGIIAAMETSGVEYLEVRAVDINPLLSTGTSKNQLLFLNCFLLLCLFENSPKFTPECAAELRANQARVAVEGRTPGFELSRKGKNISLQKWGGEILAKLMKIAQLLDKSLDNKLHSKAIETQMAKLANPELLPSAKLLKHLFTNNLDYLDYGLQLAEKQFNEFTTCTTMSRLSEKIINAAKQSARDQENIEIKENAYLAGYEDLELSTQMLLKEAIKRDIKFEILDRKSNFIRLSKGRKSQLIMQATHSALDSQITHFLMGNKIVSKQILAEAGINVPFGLHFDNIEYAQEHYGDLPNAKLVVKPSDTNYGQGISFVPPRNAQAYHEALKIAFSHSDSVIVEEFIDAKEYRFLVIDYKCVAVLHRTPANVTGNGKLTIRQLVEAKNADYRNYKFFHGYAMRLGTAEREFLAQQKLDFDSIPAKNQTVYLRGNSNVSTGGDAHDYTALMDNSYKKIAQKAARAAKARLCGVDMMVKDYKTPVDHKNYSIIEINYNPNLQIHGFPLKGEVINVAAAVLKALGF